MLQGTRFDPREIFFCPGMLSFKYSVQIARCIDVRHHINNGYEDFELCILLSYNIIGLQPAFPLRFVWSKIYVLLKQSRKFYQCQEKIKVKTLCPYFPDIQKLTGKIQTVYTSSNWIKMTVFLIEENYEENNI